MRTPSAAIIGLCLLALAPASADAQAPAQPNSHAAHAPQTPKEIAQLPSVKAYAAANERMHHDMAIAFSGNADVDFVRGMIPHHQGAVDMARIVLEHGKDPAIRRLARNVIRSQNAEISMMKAWLKKQEAARAKQHRH